MPKPIDNADAADNLENNTIEQLHLECPEPRGASEDISGTLGKGPTTQTHPESFKEAVTHAAHDVLTQAPPVTPAPFRRKPTSVSLEEFSVQDHVTLEKHRLGIWLAKFAAMMMGAIVLALLVAMIYLVFSSDTMPETSAVSYTHLTLPTNREV